MEEAQTVNYPCRNIGFLLSIFELWDPGLNFSFLLYLIKKHGGLIPIINLESFTVTQVYLFIHVLTGGGDLQTLILHAVGGPRHGRFRDGRGSRGLGV